MRTIIDIINRHGRSLERIEFFDLENRARKLGALSVPKGSAVLGEDISVQVRQASKKSGGAVLARIFLDDEPTAFIGAVFADIHAANAFIADTVLLDGVDRVGMLPEDGSPLRLHGEPLTLRVAL